MSKYKTPKTLELEDIRVPIKVLGYDDYFSVYWFTSEGYEDFIESHDEMDIPPQSEVELQMEEQSLSGEYSYSEFQNSSFEQEPAFFVVYADGFSLSWEQKQEGVLVGYVSDVPNIEPIKHVYESTTDSEIPSDHQEDFLEVIETHVPG